MDFRAVEPLLPEVRYGVAVGFKPAGNGAQWNFERIAEFFNHDGIVNFCIVAAYAENGRQGRNQRPPNQGMVQGG